MGKGSVYPVSKFRTVDKECICKQHVTVTKLLEFILFSQKCPKYSSTGRYFQPTDYSMKSKCCSFGNGCKKLLPCTGLKSLVK